MHVMAVLAWVLGAMILGPMVGLPEAHAAQARRRMAVVITGSPSLVTQVQAELTLPLSAEAEIIQTSAYRTAAARIGITKFPRSTRAAPFVGRELGVDFVIFVDGALTFEQGAPQTVMGVRLVQTGTGQLLLSQRYFLPGGKLTASSAQAVLARLVAMMGAQRAPPMPTPPPRGRDAAPPAPLPPPEPLAQAQPPQPPPRVQAPQPQPQAAPLTPGRPGAAPTLAPKVSAPQPAPRAAAPGRRPAPHPARGPAPRPRHSDIALGARLGWRRASLSPLTGRGGVAYGAGQGLGRPLVGPHLALTLGLRRVRLSLSGYAASGSYSGGPTTGHATRHVLAWAGDAAVGFNLLKSPNAEVTPMVGATFARFPIDSGPFVGLNSLGMKLGLRLVTPPWRARMHGEATIHYLTLGKLSLEARRAGRPNFAQGLQASAGPVLHAGLWRFALAGGVDWRTATFAGKTALYAPVQYQGARLHDLNVALTLAARTTW